jgi:hypothetical protein
VVAIHVDDVAPSDYAMDRATIRQRKTGRPVRFELTDETRMTIDEYLRLTGREHRHGRRCFRVANYKVADVRFCIVGSADGTTGRLPTVTVIRKRRSTD